MHCSAIYCCLPFTEIFAYIASLPLPQHYLHNVQPEGKKRGSSTHFSLLAHDTLFGYLVIDCEEETRVENDDCDSCGQRIMKTMQQIGEKVQFDQATFRSRVRP
ncbi:hypothetical protein Y032_0269g821 [Ancylostoma ceylanicum]|uniref:Uncharacterized protein n=1 Tax=Ancylostoma ceylanicum TaxID=53326 RepID=A0A016S9J0_9BILA|nr:hypothetical protein Y032_0269g821 [Ancylostoma ceylanicum]